MLQRKTSFDSSLILHDMDAHQYETRFDFGRNHAAVTLSLDAVNGIDLLITQAI